jgi:hypothetical protein
MCTGTSICHDWEACLATVKKRGLRTCALPASLVDPLLEHRASLRRHPLKRSSHNSDRSLTRSAKELQSVHISLRPTARSPPANSYWALITPERSRPESAAIVVGVYRPALLATRQNPRPGTPWLLPAYPSKGALPTRPWSVPGRARCNQRCDQLWLVPRAKVPGHTRQSMNPAPSGKQSPDWSLSRAAERFDRA